MHNAHWSFPPYEGTEPYIFCLYSKEDGAAVEQYLLGLYERRFRVWPCAYGEDAASDEIALHAERSSLLLFFFGKNSLASFRFRNVVNFALNTGRPAVRIFLLPENKTAAGEGMQMQLSGIPAYFSHGYESADALLHALCGEAAFTQSLCGEDALSPGKERSGFPVRRLALTAAALSVCALAVLLNTGAQKGWFRAGPDPYAALEALTNDAYESVDLSSFDEGALPYLSGKRIDSLTARGMGLTDVSALADVEIRSLNLADEPGIRSLRPLLNCSALETLYVSADMMEQVDEIIADADFRIVLVETGAGK